MASPLERLHERTVSPALLWIHGNDEGNLLRWVNGAKTNKVSLRGIFTGTKTTRNEQTGVDFITEGILELAADVTVNIADKWEIDDVLYKTIALEQPHGGLRPIQLKATDQQVRRAARDII